ncbi:MAG: magnesium transporter [Candidatus Altimarinota bacterium]
MPKSPHFNKIGYHQKLLNAKHEVREFRKVPVNLQGFILVELPQALQIKIIRGLGSEEIRDFCRYLDADDIADIIQPLSHKRRQTVLSGLENYEREQTRQLLKYHPQTAGGLTSLDYVIVYKRSTFSQVGLKVRKHIRKFGHLPSVIVTDQGQVIGMLSLTNVFAPPENKKNISEFIEPAKTIHAKSDQEEILKYFDKSDQENIVVIDSDGAVFGIIKPRDLISVVNQEATEDIYGLAHLEKDESVLDGIPAKVKRRSKWLIINLATAFMAASVISLFEAEIAELVLLAVYMPVIAGMGGNAGTQTLTVVIRGMALNQVSKATALKLIFNEVVTGIINGMIIGVIVALVATFLHHDPLLGLIGFISMVVALLAATLFGTLAPLILKKFKIDPAVAAGVFVTTSTDVFGFFTFLGLASLLH